VKASHGASAGWRSNLGCYGLRSCSPCVCDSGGTSSGGPSHFLPECAEVGPWSPRSTSSRFKQARLRVALPSDIDKYTGQICLHLAFKRKYPDSLYTRRAVPWPEVRDQLNRILRGWSNYFSYGTTISANRAVDNYVYERVRN